MTAAPTTPAKPVIEDVLALSPLQQGLYSMAQLDQADDPYLIAMSADIDGDVDAALLRDCAAALLVRHPNLRASFVQAGTRTVQLIPSAVDLPWQQLTAESADHADVLEAQERRRPFTLERGPVIRFLLIEMPQERWRFAVVAHHIVIDGWSLPLFVGELLALYAAGGDITVRFLRNPQGRFGVAIEDQGIDLSADHVARMGERFFRADKSGSIPGTGLGVSIVKELMDLMGGRMQVVSKLGQGTSVTLWL